MRFYVYHLVDPRDGSVFYVGKGTGSRIREHEVEAKRGVTSEKCKRIREIWASDLPVERRIIKLFDTEVEAYDFERQEIRKRPELTNLMRYPAAPVDEDTFARMMWLTKQSAGFKHTVHITVGEGFTPVWERLYKMLEPIDLAKVCREAIEQMIQEQGHERVNARARRYGVEFVQGQT